MKFFYSLAILFITVDYSCAQQITFHKKFGGTNSDAGKSIQQTIDGGYIIAGGTQSFGAGNTDVNLIKTDINGYPVWGKTYGGLNLDISNSVEQTSDGGYVIAGTTNSFGAGYNDAYLIKTDSIGDTLWTKTYGRSLGDGANYAQQTIDGGYIIIGYSAATSGFSYSDVYLIKTNSNGSPVWKKTYGGNTADADIGMFVQQTDDGGYILTGNSTTNYGNGDANAFLIKTNTSGDTLWTRTYSIMGNETTRCVQQTNDGGFIITGSTSNTFASYEDVLLIKTDSIGIPIWTKTYGGLIHDHGYFVRQTIDGGYIIIGDSWTSIGIETYLIKTDLNGDTLWTKTIKGNALSIQQTSDGGYIMVGGYYVLNADVSIIKTDSFGVSGCNQGNTLTLVGSPVTQIINKVITVLSPSTTVTRPTTQIGSGIGIITECLALEVDEVRNKEYEVAIFPNPFTNELTISSKLSNEKAEIKIWDVYGRIIYSQKLLTTNYKLQTANWPQGIYFVEVISEKGKAVRKVVKQ